LEPSFGDSSGQERVDDIAMVGKVSVEVLGRVQREVRKVEARRDGASHQDPTSNWAGGLYHSGGDHGLGELAGKKLAAKPEHLVFSVLE
jgi:hypothetical protein